MKQGTTLIAKAAFGLRKQDTKRVSSIQAGARFWVTNTVIGQTQTGFVMIDRDGRGSISQGYALTAAQVAELFQVA